MLQWYLPEGVERLVEAVLLGRHVDKHQGLAVPAQAGLQQVRQLGVPVRHVGTLWDKKQLKLIINQTIKAGHHRFWLI